MNLHPAVRTGRELREAARSRVVLVPGPFVDTARGPGSALLVEWMLLRVGPHDVRSDGAGEGLVVSTGAVLVTSGETVESVIAMVQTVVVVMVLFKIISLGTCGAGGGSILTNTVIPPSLQDTSHLMGNALERAEHGGLVILLMVGRSVVIGKLVGLAGAAELADLTGVAGAGAEGQPEEDVEDTEDQVQDAGGEYEGVPRPANLLGLGLLVVELAEGVAADHDEGEAQPGNALVGAEGRPVVLKEAVADGELGNEEEGGDHGHEDEGGGIEDEERLIHVDLDGEGPGGGHDGGEADESAEAEDVEDDHVNTLGLEALEK